MLRISFFVLVIVNNSLTTRKRDIAVNERERIRKITMYVKLLL